MDPIKTGKEQNNMHIVAILHLEKHLHSKKTDLHQVEIQHQELTKKKTENVVLLEKLQREISDFDIKVENEQIIFDNKVLTIKKQLTSDQEEIERVIQSVSQMKESRETNISKNKRKIDRLSKEISRLEHKLETVKNANNAKKEEVEIKTRLHNKLEDEKMKLNEECNMSMNSVSQKPILESSYKIPNISISQRTSILKRPNNLLPLTPKKKVTFPDLNSDTSSEVITQVSQAQVGISKLKNNIGVNITQ